MRLSLALLFTIVLAAVSSAKALPTGGVVNAPVPGTGYSTLPVEEGIQQEEEELTTEKDLDDADKLEDEALDEVTEGVQIHSKLVDSKDEEAEVNRDEEKNEESGQDSEEGSVAAARDAFVVESAFFKRDVDDSSEESSNENETETYLEATEDRYSEYKPPVDVPVKSEVEISVSSDSEELDVSLIFSNDSPKSFAKSESESSLEDNENGTDSPLEKRDTKVISESLPEEENDEISIQEEFFSDDFEETSDLEMALSEIKEIVFEEEKSAEGVETVERSDISDSETDNNDNEKNEREDASTVNETEKILVEKRVLSVKEPSEVVLRGDTRIRSPADFFGLFEGDVSGPITGEDE